MKPTANLIDSILAVTVLRLATAVLMGLGSASCSIVAPRAQLSPPVHTARDDAAIAALRRAFEAPSGHNWEYSGSLVLMDGQIIISPLRTMRQPDSASFNLDTITPGPKATLIGLFHTHPCMPETHAVPYYSPTDLGTMLAFKVASYILDECTGNVHLIDPATDNIVAGLVVSPEDRAPVPVYLTQGRIVGNIGEHGVDLDNAVPIPEHPALTPEGKANESATPQPPKGWRKTFRHGAWGQGENPGPKCGPNQRPFYLIANDGTVFFLECLRGTTNAGSADMSGQEHLGAVKVPSRATKNTR